jgi:hypothetical protein
VSLRPAFSAKPGNGKRYVQDRPGPIALRSSTSSGAARSSTSVVTVCTRPRGLRDLQADLPGDGGRHGRRRRSLD